MLQIFGLAMEIELYWHRKLRNKKTATLGTIMQSETWLNQVLLVFLSIQKEKSALAKFISLNKYVEAFILAMEAVVIAHFCSVV